MGCFSKKTPQFSAPKLPTAEEIYQQATTRAKTETPLAYGAREAGLSDLAKGTPFFESFQPTSIEQALSNQYFQNVMPDLERSIKHSYSLSGLEGSPGLAESIAKARGQVGYDVGSYLSNLGNSRALTSLSSRIGIDPNQVLSPYVNTAVNQSQAQGQMDLQQAIADYNVQIQKQKQKGGLISGLGALGGAGIGALLALPTGGMSVGMGAALGGAG